MTIQATLKNRIVIPSETYWATLDSVDEGVSEFGPIWLWTFRITSGEFDGVEIVGISSTTYSTHPSKSYQWAKALGHPDGDFNSDNVIGAACRVEVEFIEGDPDDDDKPDNNRVEKILPPVKAQMEGTPTVTTVAANVPDQGSAPAQVGLPTDPVREPPPVDEQPPIPS